jgi:hypothetical protein
MHAGQKKPRAIAIPQEYRRMGFSWVDLLVVVAALLTLAVVVNAATGHAKAAPASKSVLIEPEVSQLPNDTDLMRARIRLATGL